MSLSSRSDDISSGNNAGNVSSDEEHYSSRQSFHSLDESYYQNKPTDAATSGKLSFWPPVQAYKVLEDNGSFEFQSSKGAGIYVANMECRKAIETSAFVEFLQSIGITALVRNKTAESDLLVYIKPTICDQPESFELQVRPNKIIIIASDYVGILYGLKALKDLLTYSTVTDYEDSAKVLRLPSLLMSDAPRFRTRAVQWSYQYHIYANPHHPASAIRLLSTLKINTIYLHIDEFSEMYLQETTDGSLEVAASTVQKELFLIHDLAQSHGIRVVPTVVLRNVEHDYLTQLQLLQIPVWSQVLLVCDLTDSPMQRNKNAYRDSYLQTLSTLQQSLSPTVSSLLITVNPVVSAAVLADDIPESLRSLPISFLDYSLYQAEPLRLKPIVLMREGVESMVSYVEHVLSSASSDALLLPLHDSKDFLGPEILQNYAMLIFAALAAFGPRMTEFFATPARYSQIAKPLARHLQLTHSSVLIPPTATAGGGEAIASIPPLNHHKQALRAQQDVFVELMNWKSGLYSNVSQHLMNTNTLLSPRNSTGYTAKAAVEQALWSLSLMTDDVQPSDLPRPDEALVLYRMYRSLLQVARYHGANQQLQRRRAMRVRNVPFALGANSSGSASISTSPVPRKRVVTPAASEAESIASVAFLQSPSLLSTETISDETNQQSTWASPSSPSSSSSETDVDTYFAGVETLCMLSRAVYLAASLATAAAGDSISTNDATSAAVLAELLPTKHHHTPMLSNMHFDSTDSTTAAAAGASLAPAGLKRAAVYDNVDMSKPYAPKIIPKTAAISQLLTRVVQQNILFRNFKSEEHASIVEAFECVTAKAGEIVIKQGDSGEYFYIIEQGKLDVFMESSGLRIKVGRTLGTGDYFGELALMYNTPRAATVVSTEASTLWRIDRTTYRSIVTYHNKITSDEYFQLVSNVTILGKRLGDVLSAAELSKVVSTLEIEEFEPDAVIIRQHATGDYFYIISEGQVDVFQEQPGGDNANECGRLGVKLATLARGDCFGEKALLADDVRQASCVAVGRVICLSLSRDDFIAMIGSWQDVTAAQDVQRLALAAKRAKMRASIYDSQYHLTINLDELERLNTLGEGAFGRVLVARHKDSGQLYALKCQAKAFICAQNMQEMVLNEVAIMKQLDHPLITKLHAVMQDRRYIYFLLELLPGGEFFSFLQTAGKLTEDKARFYAASVVLSLEELHKAKIAYRDLKPENMVMDSRGYVKLVDFGLAKQVLSGSTWTMCGTPDYLAPEIILNKGHNHAVDYWALGVLVYEMIHGWPPFYHDSPMKVYEKIIMGKVDYPPTFSKALEDIVSKFLVKNPSKRLGNVKGGIADITKHKWFGSFDWRGLMAGTLLAPVMPNLSTFDAAVAAGAEEDEDESDREQHEESEWTPDLL